MKSSSAVDHLPDPQGRFHELHAKAPAVLYHLGCACGVSLVTHHTPDAQEFCRHAKAFGHMVRVQLYCPATRSSGPRGDIHWREWTENTSGPGEGLFVHGLFSGRMLCGTFSGVPATWPPGHRWSERREEINCLGCRLR